jgi:hypothetical protein
MWQGPLNVDLENRNILFHVDTLLGNDREISKYTTAVTK